jgi:hypothetical protein
MAPYLAPAVIRPAQFVIVSGRGFIGIWSVALVSVRSYRTGCVVDGWEIGFEKLVVGNRDSSFEVRGSTHRS